MLPVENVGLVAIVQVLSLTPHITEPLHLTLGVLLKNLPCLGEKIAQIQENILVDGHELYLRLAF